MCSQRWLGLRVGQYPLQPSTNLMDGNFLYTFDLFVVSAMSCKETSGLALSSYLLWTNCRVNSEKRSATPDLSELCLQFDRLNCRRCRSIYCSICLSIFVVRINLWALVCWQWNGAKKVGPKAACPVSTPNTCRAFRD